MTQLLAHLFGDYILQSDWMAQNKTKRSWPAFCHALLYSFCFVPLLFEAVRWLPYPYFFQQHYGGAWLLGHTASPFRWLPWLVIFSTHFLIDRLRLARYVVWAKNWLGPRRCWHRVRSVGAGEDYWFVADDQKTTEIFHAPTPPLWACPTGYPPQTPIWLSAWLLIIADNTLHLAVNYAALRWL